MSKKRGNAHCGTRLWLLFLLSAFSVDAQLVLGKPPVFANDESSTDAYYPEGEIVNLKCDDVPLAQSFEWRIEHAQGELVSSSRAAEVMSSRENDKKRYRCVAKNPVGVAISAPKRVRAKYLEDFDGNDESIQYEIRAGIGRHFVLRRPRLVASNGIAMKYSWYKDDMQLVDVDASHYVTSDGDLIVTNVKSTDFGEYKLIGASEDLGDIVSKMYSVQDNGVSPPIQKQMSIIYWPEDRKVIEASMPKEEAFDCVTSFGGMNEDVKIRWYIDGEQLSGSEVGVSMSMKNRRLIITNPSGFAKGEHKLECKAEAAMGRSFDQKSSYFTFISKPILRDLPEQVRKPVGSMVSLKCAIRKHRSSHINSTITWYRNGIPINSNKGKLNIEKVENDDYGMYQCEASNEAGVDMKSVWISEGNDEQEERLEDAAVAENVDDIIDEKKDSPRFVKKPLDSTVSSGTENVRFECATIGPLTARHVWLFNGHEIHAESSKYDIDSAGLTVHDVRKSDEGDYTCELDGTELKWTARLTVNGDNLIEYGPTDQKSLIGTNVEFSCEVSKEYSRKASITWFLNDVQLSTNGNSGLRITRNRKGSLIIRQVGPDNTGEYRCVVRLGDREESASATLQIIEKPAMPENVRAQLLNETTPAKVRVTWREGFDGNEPIIKHAIEMRTLGTQSGLWSDWSTIIDNIPKDDGKPCCSVEVEDLRPSSTAEFRVVASNKHGAGKPSLPSMSVTMPQQPPSAAPRNVAASARSSHSVIVQWQQPKEELASGDVLGYVVRYRLAGYSSLSWNEKNLTTKDARNAVIDDLITWREYEVQVAAYNKRGLGVFSESIEVTTSEGVPTQAPKNVAVSVINSTAVEIEFDAPDQQRIPGVNLGYKVQFWKGAPDGQLFRQEILDPDRRHLKTVIDGLEKFGHYNLTVLCYTTPGDGPKSKEQLVVTEEDVPEGVDGLSVTEVMYNGAVVSWNPPIRANGIITRYTIRHWPESSSNEGKMKYEVDGTTTNFTIDGLVASTKYVVDVMASTVKGDGPVEETRFESGVPPELPGRPSSLAIADIGATSVRLLFTPGFDGHTAIRQWIVEAKVADSSIFQHIFNISAPKARSIVVNGLRPYTEYQLRLIAENVKGRGAPSEASRKFETLQTNPESPSQRLFAEPVGSKSIGVSWSPLRATQWNGRPKGYLIVYREVLMDLDSDEEEDQDWKEIRTSALRSSEYTISDLRPFTTYQVNVFAENAFGRSIATDAVIARTYESVPSGSPRNINVSADGARSLIVKWDPVAEQSSNGDILGYKVRVVPDREALMADETRELDVPGRATLITKVTNLRPFTSYHVYLSAYTIVGSGPENASPVTVETLEDVPGSPEGFQCSFVSENEVRLKWLPPSSPNGKITNYIISYWKSHEPRSMAIDAPLLGNLLMFSATSLNPNTQYTFAVKSVNAKGESEETTAQVVTSSARVPLRNPSPPLRDQLFEASPTQIAIRWDSAADEDVESPVRVVMVAYQKTNEDEWTNVDKRFEYGKKTALIRHLTPNSNYRFRIRFVGDFLESTWSMESEWMKTMPAAPIAQPIALKATPFEATSVLLEWTVPHSSTWNSDVVGYHIHYREYPSNETWKVEEIAADGTESPKEKLLSKLTQFRHYIIRMRMYNTEGDGPFSTPVFVYVGYAVPKRNITNLAAEPLSSSSLRIKWDEWPKDETEVITSFKVKYLPVLPVTSVVSNEEEVMIVDTNECVIGDLRKFTEYQITVSPYNRAGEGRASQIRTKTLEDVPGPVGLIRFSDVLLDSCRIEWDAPAQPNGIVTSYIINYKGYRMQEEFKNEDQTKTTRNSFEAVGLAEGVTYYFSVWAETSAGKGESRSANVTIGPSLNGPPAPTKPVVVPGQSALTLQWNDGNTNGIVGHLVQAKRVSVAEEAESTRHRRDVLTRPQHPIGQWVTLRRAADGYSDKEHVTYRELQPSSFYVFRVFARNSQGVGMASPESEQLFVPDTIPDDPFYTTWWFMALVAMAAFVLIVVFVAILCITGSSEKYRREKRTRSIDSLQLADGNFASFQLKTNAGNLTRTRNGGGELPTRPGTTQSWLSDNSREPPAYGTVLADGPNVVRGSSAGSNSNAVMNMYGLATDVMPPALPNAEAMQRLSTLVGRDSRNVSGSAYVTPRNDYGRVEYGSAKQRLNEDAYDSFDEDGIESIDGSTIRGDSRRPSNNDGVEDIAKHYGGVENHYRETWRKVRDTEVVRAPTIGTSTAPGSVAGRSSATESTSESAGDWPQAPNPLANGFSSFV